MIYCCHMYISISLSVCLSVCLCACLSVCLLARAAVKMETVVRMFLAKRLLSRRRRAAFTIRRSLHCFNYYHCYYYYYYYLVPSVVKIPRVKSYTNFEATALWRYRSFIIIIIIIIKKVGWLTYGSSLLTNDSYSKMALCHCKAIESC